MNRLHLIPTAQTTGIDTLLTVHWDTDFMIYTLCSPKFQGGDTQNLNHREIMNFSDISIYTKQEMFLKLI